MLYVQDKKEHSKTLARLFLSELYSNWRYEILDDIVHDDYFVSRNSVSIIHKDNDMPMGNGKNNLLKRVKYLRDAMPDMKYEIVKIVSNGDEVIVWWIWTGTQKGKLFGFHPKNHKIRIFGSNLFTVKDGRIVNTLVTFDSFSMLVQLGHIEIVNDEHQVISQYLENIAKITQEMT